MVNVSRKPVKCLRRRSHVFTEISGQGKTAELSGKLQTLLTPPRRSSTFKSRTKNFRFYMQNNRIQIEVMNIELPQLKRERASDSVFTILRESIVTQAFPPGQRL